MSAPSKRSQTSTMSDATMSNAWTPSAVSFSKTTAPTLHRVHANTRLFGRLDVAFDRRVVWLHGPPGAGKTTLVASYLSERGIRPLWYRLDEGDADPATLFFYLATAGRRDATGPLPLLTPELRGAVPAFARRFFRELFKTPGTVVVFDDYQEVASISPVHDGLAQGLEDVPDGCHVVLISRTPPPPPFARLRLNGIVEIVEPDTLRMTQAEAVGLALERGAEAAASQIEAITRQTQGWAAGVILMLETAGADTAIPSGDAAVPEVLFDYFASEILRRMDQRWRDLLPQLSLLPSMTAAQAVALTQSSEAADLLDDLRRRNYFTTYDLAVAPRYRFHPLFHDFLDAILRAEMPREALDTLRLRAAGILDADDQPDAAVPLLAEAGAFAAITDIIRCRATELMRVGRHGTLIDWFAKLPDEAIEQEAWLCNWYAESHIYGDTVVTWARLSRAFDRFASAGDVEGQLLAWAGLAEIVRAEAFGDLARYDALIATLRALLSRSPPITSPKIMVRVAMGMALALARRTNARDEIALWQARARDAARDVDDANREQFAFMFAITDMHDANYAEALFALDLLPDPLTENRLSIAARVSGLIAHAMTLVYRIRPGDCVAYIEAALRKCDEIGYHCWSHLLAGLVLHDVCRRGDKAASTAWLARMKAYAAPYAADRGAHYHVLAAYHHLLHDDLRTANAHAEQAVVIAIKSGWPFFEAIARLVLAETLIDTRSFGAAEAELDRLDGLLDRNATRVVDAGAICARADLDIARGDLAAARATLARGLDVGRRRQDRRFGLSAARLRRLFAFAITQGIEPDYVSTLVQNLSVMAPDPFDERWPHALRIETLGGLCVSRDGAPLRFTRKTPKRLIQLLKVIVANGGRNVPEDRLVDAVWPDEDGDAARSALTIAIHRLRKLLGDSEAILVSGGTIGFDPARCWIDIWTVDHLLKAEPTATEMDAEAAMAKAGHAPRCERVLALYKGDFLPEDQDAAWAAPARNRLRRRFARMICIRAEMVEAAAGDLFQRALDVAPLAEDLYQGWMRHHLAEGRGADGLAVYARLQDVMRDSESFVPSRASETLHQKLRQL